MDANRAERLGCDQRMMVLIACLIGCLAGCQRPREAGTQRQDGLEKDAARPVVTLRLLVVDDPEMAGSIKKLRGEWTERTHGGRLQVLEWTLAEMFAAKSLPADLVIYPSRHLGTLVQKKWLRPLRESMLHATQFAWADLFPAVRDREIAYGGVKYASPYGSPPLMLCYNPQLLAAARCDVPRTWTDYHQVVGRLKQQAVPCLLPLAGKSAAMTLLARAVSYASQAGHRALLFDVDTFQPRIAGPPFVRALEQIIAESSPEVDPNKKSVTPETLAFAAPTLGFSEAVKKVAQGRSAMTLGWPGVACSQPLEEARVSYAMLPSTKDIYSVTRNQWETNRSDTPTVLLGVAGRLASVTCSSRNATSSFKLLLWLGGDGIATGISASSHSTLWYRRSQVKVATRWLADCQGQVMPGLSTAAGFPATAGIPGAAGTPQHGIGQMVARALASEDCFLLPRISGIDDYLESLGNAVRTALAGETAIAALQQAADQWDQITGRLGKESQQMAYRAHLGF